MGCLIYFPFVYFACFVVNKTKAMTKTIHIQYVAMLKDQAGKSEETLKTKSATLDHLYTELAEKHQFPWPASAMRPGINDNIAHWNSELQDGDRVIFLPPPSGG